MITFDIRKSDSSVIAKLDGIASKGEKRIMQALFLGAQEVRNRAIKGMKNTPKTARGKRYKRGAEIHIASAPGKYPAIDRGGLWRSIIVDKRPFDMEVEVGSSIARIRSKFGKKKAGDPNYPLFLEEGTKRMKPRPWMAPSMRGAGEFIRQEIEKAVADITGGSST